MPKNLYIISGPNGAGKTTISYTVLPEILNCNEFVNADEIAKGLSPFNPNKLAIQAGKLMLKRIDDLLDEQKDFAIETTLSSKTFIKTITRAKKNGYFVTVLFLWLNSIELAVERVKIRVSEGGHNIPEETIRRRYKKGLKNFFNLYIPITDYWLLVNNSKTPFEIIAEGRESVVKISDQKIWKKLIEKYYDD